MAGCAVGTTDGSERQEPARKVSEWRAGPPRWLARWLAAGRWLAHVTLLRCRIMRGLVLVIASKLGRGAKGSSSFPPPTSRARSATIVCKWSLRTPVLLCCARAANVSRLWHAGPGGPFVPKAQSAPRRKVPGIRSRESHTRPCLHDSGRRARAQRQQQAYPASGRHSAERHLKACLLPIRRSQRL